MSEEKHKKGQRLDKDSGIGIFNNPGSGPSDSPIIITDGSLNIFSIDDDFQPSVGSNLNYALQKSASTSSNVTMRPGGTPFAPGTTAGSAWVLTLKDSNGVVVTISAVLQVISVPADATPVSFNQWGIRVGSSNTNLLRASGKLKHPNFVLDARTTGTLLVNGGPFPGGLPNSLIHFSIHFS